MVERNAFLDKGVLLGFCFTVDPHHRKCRQYFQDNQNLEFYITNEVEEAYYRKRQLLIDRHQEAIFNHLEDLKKEYDIRTELDPLDIDDIKSDVLSKDNSAYNYLLDWYNRLAGFTTVDEVDRRLRNLARDIETNSNQKKNQFDSEVTVWQRDDDYPDLEVEFSDFKTEDIYICIDSHDVAVKTNPETELTTTDYKDFGRDGQRERILSNTEIERVIIVASLG